MASSDDFKLLNQAEVQFIAALRGLTDGGDRGKPARTRRFAAYAANALAPPKQECDTLKKRATAQQAQRVAGSDAEGVPPAVPQLPRSFERDFKKFWKQVTNFGERFGQAFPGSEVLMIEKHHPMGHTHNCTPNSHSLYNAVWGSPNAQAVVAQSLFPTQQEYARAQLLQGIQEMQLAAGARPAAGEPPLHSEQLGTEQMAPQPTMAEAIGGLQDPLQSAGATAAATHQDKEAVAQAAERMAVEPTVAAAPLPAASSAAMAAPHLYEQVVTQAHQQMPAQQTLPSAGGIPHCPLQATTSAAAAAAAAASTVTVGLEEGAEPSLSTAAAEEVRQRGAVTMPQQDAPLLQRRGGLSGDTERAGMAQRAVRGGFSSGDTQRAGRDQQAMAPTPAVHEAEHEPITSEADMDNMLYDGFEEFKGEHSALSSSGQYGSACSQVPLEAAVSLYPLNKLNDEPHLPGFGTAVTGTALDLAGPSIKKRDPQQVPDNVPVPSLKRQRQRSAARIMFEDGQARLAEPQTRLIGVTQNVAPQVLQQAPQPQWRMRGPQLPPTDAAE
ncbi:hypothetical protein JKP88DRAFT_292165 [Tribonema minus]|uniref:Uncharacterized protein n=1 Tax=Tribonema minus TaxID=303371 RepID=A0A836CN68_9STRA|nr:hypothetical protein JKP88DRAFT_292165 [Tribonema minus]